MSLYLDTHTDDYNQDFFFFSQTKSTVNKTIHHDQVGLRAWNPKSD